MRIGVLAIQGDYEAHAKSLASLNVPVSYVTHPKHLSGIQGLILPGGESTTMLTFLREDNFLQALSDFASAGRRLFGTCAGAILLAKEVTHPTQSSLNLLDVTIERNAYGRQLSSHIGRGESEQTPFDMVFIRAPKIVRVGPQVKVFATYLGNPVGVIDRHLLTTFHPELTQNTRIHKMFIELCQQAPI